jgi:hypothetical protein
VHTESFYGCFESKAIALGRAVGDSENGRDGGLARRDSPFLLVNPLVIRKSADNGKTLRAAPSGQLGGRERSATHPTCEPGSSVAQATRRPVALGRGRGSRSAAPPGVTATNATGDTTRPWALFQGLATRAAPPGHRGGGNGAATATSWSSLPGA